MIIKLLKNSTKQIILLILILSLLNIIALAEDLPPPPISQGETNPNSFSQNPTYDNFITLQNPTPEDFSKLTSSSG